MMLPLFVLNMLAGVTGGVWLLVLGQWEIVALGLTWAALAPFVLTLLILPVLGTAFAADRARGLVGAFFVALTVLLLGGIMLATSVYLFDFARDAAHAKGEELLPFMLLAYGAAASPWVSMTRGGGWQGAGDSFLPLMGVQVSAVAIGVTLFIAPYSDVVLLAQIGAAAFIGAVSFVFFAIALHRPNPY